MKKVGTVLIILVCLALIISGKFYWNNKLEDTAAKAKESASETPKPSVKKIDEKAPRTKKVSQSIDNLTKHLPDKLKKVIQKAKDDKTPVTIVMTGGQEIKGLADLFQARLDGAYDDVVFKVVEKTFKEETSLDVYHKDTKKLFESEKPDVVIYTPLVMNDDHKVSTSDTEAVIGLLGNDIQKLYPDVVYMVEPSNYTDDIPKVNDRIDEIATDIKKKDVIYLDYLKRWPSGGKMADVVKEDSYTPNEKGLKIWADYLGDYFTGESTKG